MPIGKILILQGLPGSGKSFFSKSLIQNNQSWVRVNRDDIRAMFGLKWNQETEWLVKEVEEMIVKRAIPTEYNVVVDDTNLAQSTCERWSNVAKFLDCPIEFKFFNTPIEECIRRDSLRPNPVGEKIITNLYNKYLTIAKKCIV